jgi:hypothetical protein
MDAKRYCFEARLLQLRGDRFGYFRSVLPGDRVGAMRLTKDSAARFGSIPIEETVVDPWQGAKK